MSLEIRLRRGGTLLLVLGGAFAAVLASPAGAQVRGKSPLATVTVESAPSNVDLVNKALNPGASDPNVPLPHPSLSAPAGPPATSAGPQIFGRQEQGGGVLGLRVPIPADRGAAAGNTRYSVGGPSSEAAPDAR